ncbi:MAG: dethiobiotin synthase [Desulfocapsa sp.]|nr:MAG: dethiobiotin synthase [Desulfocapsa sp.]
MGKVTCVSGIDTDIGKTVVTGLLGKALRQSGFSVITQKITQTGCSGVAEDVRTHRKIMEMDLQPEDNNGLTCPYVFEKACSPHLAAKLAGQRIDPMQICAATATLTAAYDHVLLEGVGGLLVPLGTGYTFLDYLQEQGYPLILVSSPSLGSINHTLSAMELSKNRGIYVNGIVYNCFDSSDTVIREDSRKVFLEALTHYGFPETIVDLPNADEVEADSDMLLLLQQLVTVREKK